MFRLIDFHKYISTYIFSKIYGFNLDYNCTIIVIVQGHLDNHVLILKIIYVDLEEIVAI